MADSEVQSLDVLVRLKEAQYRHALALALSPLSLEKATQELALSRAIVEVQTDLMLKLGESKTQGDLMFDKMVWLLNELDPHIRRGKKQLDSAKKGHAAVHGTGAEKDAKKKLMRSVCERISVEHPRWGITAILSTAAVELDLSIRSLQRNLPGIGKTLRPR